MNVYDFDNTIYHGDSSLDFFLFVIGKKPYLIVLLPVQIWGIIRYLLGIGSKEQMKEKFFIFIRFIPVEEMVFLFWEKNKKKIQSWYLEQKAPSDIIISASPEILLNPLICGYLGVGLIASKIDIQSGRCMGRNCSGSEKVKRLYTAYPDIIIDNFYSDSLSDTPLAEKANHAFILKGQKSIPWHEYKINFFEKIKQKYPTKDFILFVFCGGMGTLTNFVFSLFISMMLNPSVAYIFGYGISLFVAYTLNAKLLFKSGIRIKQFLKFIVSYIPNFLILFVFVLIFLNIFNWNKIIVYVLAGLLGLPLTFILVKLFAFGKKKIK